MRLTILLLTIILLSSCQKEVHINLGGTAPIVVVQGQIQTGQPPIVFLTSTISFFATVNLTTLENSFVHNAVITVSNGTQTVTLKEYSIDTSGGAKFYAYSLDTSSINNIMLGEVGKYYTLTIKSNGATYTAVTKIPTPKGVDTMWFGTPLFHNKNTPDSAYELFATYTDPDTPGNYVRSFTQRNHEGSYANGIYSDQGVNGIVISNIALLAGYRDSTNAPVDTLRYFYPGDTVTLNWCQIDKGVYTFWNTEAYAQQTTGDPFASPINVLTNIKGGAIGIWAGYSTALYTKVVP